MKTNLKLNTLASQSLSEVEMNQTKGGISGCCECACAYVNSGGSSSDDNGDANMRAGKNSRDGGDLHCPW
ncbi:MAG: TIGR04149 family rSAM-modified RiPP [Candidatus Symbiothrix sp.]|jgi:natural product precursor|nr:TIGR04149 family rSAM-modified RiPP [Candidatus Symbiothrix sp.]